MKNPSMVHRAENMWCMFAPYRHFGNEIRAQLEKNDRTQKEGQMRALMEQMQRLTK